MDTIVKLASSLSTSSVELLDVTTTRCRPGWTPTLPPFLRRLGSKELSCTGGAMSSRIKLTEGRYVVVLRVKESAATVEGRLESASQSGSKLEVTNFDSGETMEIEPRKVQGVADE